MCGRYNVTDDPRVRELMRQLNLPLYPEPRLNIAPGAQGQIVFENSQGRHLQEAIWSLLIEPKPDGQGYRPNPQWHTFNAQSARLGASPLWRRRYPHQRAIIPASGFHEWVAGPGKTKQCMNIQARDAAIAFAGLYECWQFGEDQVYAFTIITLPAHPRFAHVHAKSLPLMLEPADFDLWLDPNFTHTDDFADLMQSGLRHALEVTPIRSPKDLQPTGTAEIIDAD